MSSLATSTPLLRRQPRTSSSYLLSVPLLTAGASLLLLFQTSSMTSDGYALRELEATRQAEQQELYRLEAEIAGLQSLAHVEGVAAQKLGMVHTTRPVFLAVSRSPSSRELAQHRPPAAAKARASDSPGWLAPFAELARQAGRLLSSVGLPQTTVNP
ncbi:MAG: hypothetical protein HYY05_07580 [Chloroflexi bacterium]|nr:hypothetical protein [Chloroflexota bacterium]